MSEHYIPPNPSLWKGRMDAPMGERFFQQVECYALNDLPPTKNQSILLAGFASEAGIIRNAGRPGAKEGPDAIKRALAGLPFHGKQPFVDVGNITCPEDDLESAQQQLASLVDIAHQKGYISFCLGGGHEIAWAHFQGLAKHYKDMLIINFDAHFDLRPWQPGNPGTSGTPFSQIAQYCNEHSMPFNYACLGIQPQGNTDSLFQQAQTLNTQFLTAEDMYQQSLEKQLAFLERIVKNHSFIYLSFCMDVLSAAYAPGVSAPQPLGLTPWQILPLLKYLLQTGKVIGLDIAELSPALDESDKTVKLAAMLSAEIIATIK